ncbi:protein KINESIN LIGHT CHAIN-RELATED 1-like [Benincasa hispida]|uniref:protein KINESIN LIGHT CHAIN-RELATED 1-like n=1 Tax=Benincasa hispida TaxID=102211 RepID=UPI001901376A|nr:protein KINESIN LIGHT CHAIN-RELATED 1-like [Benincasa hispida]XP_038906716.1 protein KINESIN LIGHT CHAIN-RELATED 1-like [Benincasa hispida]
MGIEPKTPHLRIQVPPIVNDDTQHQNNNYKTMTPPWLKLIPSPSPSPQKSEPNRTWLDNPDHGPYLLKLARDTIISGESPTKALDYAVRAAKSFERFPGLGVELPMSLHVVAAIHCRLGQFDEAISVLERSIDVAEAGNGLDHALAKYSGYMQLGDTYSMLGQLDRSISCYEAGLMIQINAFTDSDPQVAETCRYLAEAHVQAMQFEKAKKYCKKTLDIHKQHSPPASPQEATDRRLMALICEALGDSESALEHLVLASMAMIAHGHDTEVAAIDASIGDIYASLCRFDEAIFAYQKALTIFKSTKGESHLSVASLFIRLAELYNRTGKSREAKSYVDNALRIYLKPPSGASCEELSSGLVEISSVYEATNEPEEAFRVLQRATMVLEQGVGGGRWSGSGAVAGIEAQMGVMFYMVGKYGEARKAFEGAIGKLRAGAKSAMFGVLLNQMGLACIQLYKIGEAVKLFQEAKVVLEEQYGVYHSDTLAVSSNLAAAYDAMGSVEEAIEILEHILKVREEMLGTANPEVDEEKRRLEELLKEAGRARNKKAKSLQILLGSNPLRMKKEVAKRWSGGFSFRA